MTGRMPEEGVNPVEFPVMAQFVWAWFLDLHECRAQGMSGLARLTSLEMQAYFSLEGIVPMGWEVAAIRRLDRLVVQSLAADD